MILQHEKFFLRTRTVSLTTFEWTSLYGFVCMDFRWTKKNQEADFRFPMFFLVVLGLSFFFKNIYPG